MECGTRKKEREEGWWCQTGGNSGRTVRLEVAPLAPGALEQAALPSDGKLTARATPVVRDVTIQTSGCCAGSLFELRGAPIKVFSAQVVSVSGAVTGDSAGTVVSSCNLVWERYNVPV